MTPARHRPRRRRSDRGAALLVVIVSIAIVTALAVDLAYETRVRLQIAANGRDALRAQALAKSGVNLSRLVLVFQRQLDEASGQMCGAFPGAQQGQAQAQGDAACPRPQIWGLVPISSGLVQALFGGAETERLERDGAPLAAFGDFEGAFDATIEDEGTKVNLQLDSPFAQTGALGMQVEALLRLVCDPRWDPLFDREDANGQRFTRQDLAVHLRDWADDDEVSSTLMASYPGGGACNVIVPPRPFEQGFGDENFPYDRGRDRYRAKNARLSSLEELHLVAGVSDAFMAAFGDRVTVYLPRDAGINVNAPSAAEQLRIAWLMADAAGHPVLADPAFPEQLTRAISAARMGGLLTLSPTQFAGLLQALGVPVRPEFLAPGPRNPFTDTSVVYRIRSTGGAGDVSRTIDAVVTFDPNQNNHPDAGKPLAGRLLRWREE